MSGYDLLTRKRRKTLNAFVYYVLCTLSDMSYYKKHANHHDLGDCLERHNNMYQKNDLY